MFCRCSSKDNLPRFCFFLLPPTWYKRWAFDSFWWDFGNLSLSLSLSTFFSHLFVHLDLKGTHFINLMRIGHLMFPISTIGNADTLFISS
jgi:hypothetical protein